MHPLKQVSDTFPQLMEWADFVRTPFIPDPGSPLDSDGRIFPWLSGSELAWQGLCAAQDHLKGFRAWYLAAHHPQLDTGLFPTATFSLLRAALVGGALASWLLGPDDAELRIGRSLAAAQEWHRNHLNWGKTMKRYALDRAEHDKALEHIEKRMKQIEALRRGRTPSETMKPTNVITEANAELWPGDPGRADATLALWQAGSGDAHAFGWPILARGNVRTPLDSEMAGVASAPTDMDVANAYLCAYDFAAFGFHRLIELGTV